ncbi:hypothetical protein [Chitinophaga tropicalis]|uniref:Uncharacterized protein n=1 Tax=Chitinophaga tropicalis TaxID=2683588 RepID=A0A7K1UAL2_9BACT|nr:hypothetical protein [Chitinophaga tropicalis]MVT11336.1 hypothetical protein [Chitinophaga tropicalis]
MVEYFLIITVSIAVIIALRRIFWWYWGLNDIIKNQKKQELLLELLLSKQIGDLPKVRVLEKSTGTIKEISIDGWVDLQHRSPDKFERV